MSEKLPGKEKPLWKKVLKYSLIAAAGALLAGVLL
jgi:hypothetical protein